jgi:CheY-like chemotaxis protein
LRADQSLCSTRLIALTGYAQYADKQKALDAGFDAHLTQAARPGQAQQVADEKEVVTSAPPPQSIP